MGTGAFRKKAKSQYKEILKELAKDYCDGRYCILRVFLEFEHPSDRLLAQIACIDKLKFEESKKLEKDIGWDESTRLWIERGYAERFVKAYNEGDTFKEIYELSTDQ